MRKKDINITLIGIIVAALILLVFYYNFNSNKTDIKYLANGGFKRTLLPVNMSLKQGYELPKGFYNIIGVGDDKTLIKEAETGSLITFNTDHTKEIIKMPKEINPENVFYTSVHPYDKQLIYLICNNDRSVFLFNIGTQKIVSIFKFSSYFDKIIRASDSSFYVFNQTDKMNQLVLNLVQFNKAGKDTIIKTSQIYKEAMTDDGIFQSSGKNLIYVNHYNNKISIIDTALRKETFYKTIDTVTTRPKTITIRNNTITKFAKAPRPVNQLMQVSDSLLFINSYVRSEVDNENDPKKESDFFDVYDLKNNCKYKGTIYIKRYKKERAQDFMVTRNKFVLQYPNMTLIYDFSL
ncbi:hypothetical protein [Sphingobacterium griseoflavum]|uniref:Uncharacterized protein n=1 Tax=Sphingobacterium griseoflavum TaxID=1474952 RepID=A0ABQ3HXZ9_9SPHI|nr:hypothetical protein [Sphingobacterium griseoflavum]GHE34192.1 hypothetical protein GCM10017764_16900 [Sphingobacterium griseoflavum]